MLKSILLLFFSFFVSAQDYKKVAVGKARKAIHKWHFALTPCSDKEEAKNQYFQEAYEIMKSDFAFYSHKLAISTSVEEEGLNLRSKIKEYKDKNYYYIVDVNCKKSNIIGIDIQFSSKVFDQTFNGTRSLTRNLVHQISNSLFKRAYGSGSIFLEKIAFAASGKTKLSKTKKELHLMDFDGFNVKKISNHGGIVLTPSFSPDNSRILYSVILGGKIKLYEVDLRTLNKRVISQKKGINSGAIYSEDGRGIYLTQSFDGNAEIYYQDLQTNALRKVTSHFGVDVDPSISKDGSLMAFLSSRAGKAMVYTLNPMGKEREVRRVSFVGKFNATPRFSPNAKEIVFVSWLDNTFDLFRIYPNGQGLIRLTRDFGSNEDPSYSPDNEFIIFSSKRVIDSMNVDQNIYIMNREGGGIRKISDGLGLCSAPRITN